jgi:hypothetical protein
MQYGIYVSTVNDPVSTMSRFIDVELRALDTIEVKTYDDVRIKVEVSGRWDGTYKKLLSSTRVGGSSSSSGQPADNTSNSKSVVVETKGNGAASIKTPETNAKSIVPKSNSLLGSFSGDDDSVLEFSSQDFAVLRTSSGEREAGYALFSLGSQLVFQLKLLRTASTPAETRNYIAKYEIKETATATETVLTLIPAKIGMNGAEPTHERTIIYEKQLEKKTVR